MIKVDTTKRVQFSEFGGVGVLDIVEYEMPHPGPGEVLVEVLSAGINHIEALIREGGLIDELGDEFPQTQGNDFSGIVQEVGEGVTNFHRHSEVIGQAGRASHAYHVIVPAANIVSKPKHLSWEVAGSLATAGVTAYDTIEEVHVSAGDTVVISAAAGGVGSMEIQLAKLRGAHVIGTCGERNFDYLRQLGIKPVVYGDGLADRIRALAPGGVTSYIDNFGQDGQQLATELGVIPSRYRSSEDRQQIELHMIAPDDEFSAHSTKVLQKLAVLADERKLDILISGFFPFRLVQDAFDDLERLHARGKIVLGMKPVNDSSVTKARDIAEAHV
jgi:NADPH:quinone reductase